MTKTKFRIGKIKTQETTHKKKKTGSSWRILAIIVMCLNNKSSPLSTPKPQTFQKMLKQKLNSAKMHKACLIQVKGKKSIKTSKKACLKKMCWSFKCRRRKSISIIISTAHLWIVISQTPEYYPKDQVKFKSQGKLHQILTECWMPQASATTSTSTLSTGQHKIFLRLLWKILCMCGTRLRRRCKSYASLDRMMMLVMLLLRSAGQTVETISV